jgi:hypothetical protein
MILHRLAPNHRLRAKSAPRRGELILLPSSTHRPGRTSRLLSCHRSISGVLLADLAQILAKMRSRKNRNQASREQVPWMFVAGDVPSLWRPHVRHVAPSRSQPRRRKLRRLCWLFADRAQNCDVVMSGIVDSGRESSHGNIDAPDHTCNVAQQCRRVFRALELSRSSYRHNAQATTRTR